jgi:hypothetical protein
MEQPNQPPAVDAETAEVLRLYAPRLNRRRWRWPLTGPVYHLMADALYWVDEVPLWRKPWELQNAMRLLWHYRTGLILGESREYAEYWELGKQLFPRWVGFHPSRCQPSRRYIAVYRAGSEEATRWIAEAENDSTNTDRAPD